MVGKRSCMARMTRASTVPSPTPASNTRTAGGRGWMLASSSETRCATTHFSLQVLTNSRYFCRLSKNRKTGSPVASGTVFVATTAVFTADLRGSRLNEAFDQPIDFARLFHMREVPRLLDDMNGQANRQRFGVRHRDDPVVAAPDNLHRQWQLGDLGGDVKGLPATGEAHPGNPRQCRGDAVQPLIAQHVLDHRATDERRVMDQQIEHLGSFAAARGAHETADEPRIDLGPQP